MDKTKILLIWNGKTGQFEEHFLKKPLTDKNNKYADTDEKEYFVCDLT